MIITSPIKETIGKMAGKFRSSQELTKFINKEFNIEADYHSIYYQEKLAYNKKFGRFEDDAKTLLEIVAQEKIDDQCRYSYSKTSNNELENFIYASKKMQQLYNDFNDVIIIDSTLKKNWFNMPLVIFGGIDSFGKTRIVCFALISNETTQSYEWIFNEFLILMNQQQPRIVYSDEYDAIAKGH